MAPVRAHRAGVEPGIGVLSRSVEKRVSDVDPAIADSSDEVMVFVR